MKRWRYTDSFWGGFVLAGSLHSLLEDAIGQEGMARMVRDGWVSAKVTVPLALFGVLIAAFGYFISRRKETE